MILNQTFARELAEMLLEIDAVVLRDDVRFNWT